MPRDLNSRFDMLLAHTLRCPEVFTVATSQLSPESFDGEFLYPHRIIWAAALDIYKTYNVMPQQATLLAEATRRMDEQNAGDPLMGSQDRQVIIELIQAVFVLPEHQLLPKYALEHLQEVAYKSRLIPVLQQAAQATDPKQVTAAMSKLQTVYRSAQITAPREVDLFSDEHQASLEEVRIPTTCDYFDMLLGGGVSEGEVYGLLGGSGGGKTMTAVDVSCQLAKQGYHVNFFSYEQPVSGDITRRFYSNAGHIRRDELTKPRSERTADTQRRIEELKVKMAPNLHVYDMSGRDAGFGGIDEIERILRQDQHRGYRAVLNVFDWLLVSIRRYMGATNKPENEVRGEITRYVDKCLYYGSEYGGAYLILNQLAPATIGSPGRLPKWADSAEGKNFAWLLTGCFVLGAPDKDNRMYIGIDKNRGNARSHVAVELDPVYNRMILREDLKHDNRSGQGFVPKDAALNNVPQETADGKVTMPGEDIATI